MTANDFGTLRNRMVDNQLRTTDVTNHAVLSAFQTIARELFVPAGKEALAYVDIDVELGGGRYLMEPSPLARLVQLADLKAGEKVLIIGAGTGYGAAIASRLAGHVTALEENAGLIAHARTALSEAGIINVDMVEGSLDAGCAANSPFDVILIEGAVEKLPEKLLAQLADGGRLVAVEGLNLTGVARVHVKTGKAVSARRAFNLAIKPLAAFGAEPAFAF